MAKRTLSERVAILEQRVVKLEELPADVAALRLEFSQFRKENTREHSAIRAEMRAGFAQVRVEFDARFEDAKRHALVLHEHLVALIKTIKAG